MKSLTAFAITSHDANARAVHTSQNPADKRVRSIIASLTGSCALMMTGFGIATPIFARRLGELGADVEVLSLMAMASALAQFLLAPCMGALADRFGRRRIVLFALSGLAITTFAFPVVRSTDMYIVLRFLQGAFSVGILPAAMGVIADLVPEQHRTRWVGVLMSGYAVGLTIGPVLGGLLFEQWGFTASFGIAALLDLLALFVVWVRVPETREAAIRHVQQREKEQGLTGRELAASLPRPLPFFAALLLLDAVAVFGMAFIEPQMVFYLYNTLSWTTTQYGLMMGGYGVATLIGQVALGQLGDHLGGKLLLALGFLFNSALSLGLLLFHQFSLLAPLALLAGLGSAFITTRMGVCYLDMTTPQHRSVALGIRESAISLAAVAGPLLATFVSRWLIPQGIFTVAALTTLAAVILVLVVLKPQGRAKVPALKEASEDSGRKDKRQAGVEEIDRLRNLSVGFSPRKEGKPMKAHMYQLIVIAVLLSLLALSVSPLPAQALSEQPGSNFAAIDSYVTAQMHEAQIPGLALGIIHNDQIVHLRGFGAANPAGQPVTPQTPFIIGSLSKSFTALAIMQLVEAGKMELDAPVQRYLPWFHVADRKASAQITVHQLLHQTSGLPPSAGVEPLAGTGQATLEQRVRELSTVALTQPVGKTFQYSNTNYVVLGLLVQVVSKQSYGAYIQQHIFAPLQMHHSFVSQVDAMKAGMATWYRWWFGHPVAASLPYPQDQLPTAFLISSAEDMTHYLIAHNTNGYYPGTRALSVWGMAELHSTATIVSASKNGYCYYGMGWFIGSTADVPTLSHSGDTANFHAEMVLLDHDGWGIVLLFNANGWPAQETAFKQITKG